MQYTTVFNDCSWTSGSLSSSSSSSSFSYDSKSRLIEWSRSYYWITVTIINNSYKSIITHIFVASFWLNEENASMIGLCDFLLCLVSRCVHSHRFWNGKSWKSVHESDSFFSHRYCRKCTWRWRLDFWKADRSSNCLTHCALFVGESVIQTLHSLSLLLFFSLWPQESEMTLSFLFD